MNAVISAGLPAGQIQAPPSKSFAHRMMICAALARGTGSIRGISGSEDMGATMDCLAALGVSCKLDGDVLTVEGGPKKPGEAFLPCRESGSTLRFFLPIAAALGGRSVFTGTSRLIERGIGVYEDLFASVGIRVEKNATAIVIDGRLPAGDYAIPGNISSQFVTGLLFALSLHEKNSTLTVLPPVESRPYIDITLATMKEYGVEVDEIDENRFMIRGGQAYAARNAEVEGDWSNAAVWYALKMLGSPLHITGLNEKSLQGDKVCVEHLKAMERDGAEIDLSDCPDLGPVLMAAAAAGRGALFTGTRRLAIKESDRGAAMAEELARFGVTVQRTENTIRVPGGCLKAPNEKLDGHNDHRIVMATAMLCCVTGGTVTGIGAVSKSYPDLFDKLIQAGVKITYEV